MRKIAKASALVRPAHPALLAHFPAAPEPTCRHALHSLKHALHITVLCMRCSRCSDAARRDSRRGRANNGDQANSDAAARAQQCAGCPAFNSARSAPARDKIRNTPPPMRVGAAISRLTPRATQYHMTDAMETSARTRDTSARGRGSDRLKVPPPSTRWLSFKLRFAKPYSWCPLLCTNHSEALLESE